MLQFILLFLICKRTIVNLPYLGSPKYALKKELDQKLFVAQKLVSDFTRLVSFKFDHPGKGQQ